MRWFCTLFSCHEREFKTILSPLEFSSFSSHHISRLFYAHYIYSTCVSVLFFHSTLSLFTFLRKKIIFTNLFLGAVKYMTIYLSILLHYYTRARTFENQASSTTLSVNQLNGVYGATRTRSDILILKKIFFAVYFLQTN